MGGKNNILRSLVLSRSPSILWLSCDLCRYCKTKCHIHYYSFSVPKSDESQQIVGDTNSHWTSYAFLVVLLLQLPVQTLKCYFILFT